jgi:ergothioneine biosynthesis protein EgtB
MTKPAVARRTEALAEAFLEVRSRTEALCAPLAVDDYQVQSVAETSPPKWHIAHVTWFFETFLLKPALPDYEPVDPRYETIFNSYYNAVGPMHPRHQRHTLSRPTVPEVYAYRAHVDGHMLRLLDSGAARNRQDLLERAVLGLNHEQQHQELLLMDVKRNFFANPLYPAYAPAADAARMAPAPMRWIDLPGGIREIGHTGRSFSFDNECPRHKVFMRDYRLGSRPVTNGEYLEFVASGAYARPDLWLADGWTAVRERGWQAPLYWVQVAGEWHEMTLHGLAPLCADVPVCHVSYYEADAYARWRSARLPTEAEWEAAAADAKIEGNFCESGLFHPRAAADPEERQWFGDVWEWTSSAYSPYPGFRPLPGALGEYNGKFMANQYVLRGGCCATPRSHMRVTYRNFFYPHERWAFAGIRLACDG